MFAFSVPEKPDCPAQKEGAQSDCRQGERADSPIIFFAGCCTSREHFTVVSEEILATFLCSSQTSSSYNDHTKLNDESIILSEGN